jgi:hypothetical protein
MEMTYALINRQNSAFWQKQSLELDRTISDEPAIFKEALQECSADEIRHHVSSRRPLEEIIKEIKERQVRYRMAFSRAGGRANKTDRLGRLIEQIVQDNPNISCEELEKALRRQEGTSGVDEINATHIWLTDGKQIPFSGLKDRLSRAKRKQKKLKSR